MRSRASWLVVLSLVTACGDSSPAGPPDAPQGVDAAPDAAVVDADLAEPDAPGAQPTVQPAACRFTVPDSDGFDEGVDYACGDLTTVLDRDAGTGVVTLHFLRVFSSAQTGRMTIWLDGGPGGSGQRMVNRIATRRLRDLWPARHPARPANAGGRVRVRRPRAVQHGGQRRRRE